MAVVAAVNIAVVAAAVDAGADFTVADIVANTVSVWVCCRLLVVLTLMLMIAL